jgi:glucose-6-phosphate 1-dehydrogenase
MDNHSDAFVFFGATGDLAYKKIFPALQAMLKRGSLNVPVIGVAKAGWNLDQFKARALDGLEKHGGADPEAFRKLSSLLRYVDGDYGDPATFEALGRELQGSRRPAHYLAIPPAMVEPVLENLIHCHCMANARMIVEKPFGHDLASARHLNKTLLRNFEEKNVFRIDHYLGKRPVNNLVVFRFANTFIESFWNRNYIYSVQITMAEDFGVQGRGAFYDQTGTIRDVIQNHLFQVLCNIAMEPPVRTDSESVRDEKVISTEGHSGPGREERGPGPVPRVPGGKGRVAGLEYRNLRRGETRGEFLALAGGAVLYPGRQASARHLHRDCLPVAKAARYFSSGGYDLELFEDANQS